MNGGTVPGSGDEAVGEGERGGGDDVSVLADVQCLACGAGGFGDHGDFAGEFAAGFDCYERQ